MASKLSLTTPGAGDLKSRGARANLKVVCVPRRRLFSSMEDVVVSLMGLDIGTTGTKANVFNEYGRLMATAYREYSLEHPQPGWIELDPDEVWENVKEAVKEATDKAADDPVKALAISVLGEAAVPVDIRGMTLDNSIIGFDNRAADIFQYWLKNADPAEIMKITGQPPSQMFTLAKLMWIQEKQPELFSRMEKYLTFGEYAQWKMGLNPRISYSMAARTMAFDIYEKRYSEKICSSADINSNLFGEAAASGEVVGMLRGKIAGELGVAERCVVCVGSHDQPAGALGSGVIEPGIAMDATGTVECFAVAMEEPVVNQTMLNNNLACYPHAYPDMYISLAYNFTGGALLKWVRDKLAHTEHEDAISRGVDVYDVIVEEMSENPTDIFVQPHFTMAGTPYMDPDPVGAIVGIDLSTTRAELFRSVLEGISYEMKLNLKVLEEAGVEVEAFRAIGGGAKSDFWLQLKADIYNRPVVRMEVDEAASLGMAICAGVGAGIYGSFDEAIEEVVIEKETFTPDPVNAAFYNKMLERYEEIYPALKKWQKAIGISKGTM